MDNPGSEHEHNPLVSLVILSWNRKQQLQATLRQVLTIPYSNVEIIVVDNASTDGSPEMVRDAFPSLCLVQLPANIGITGWNAGFTNARGKYIVVLDDDSCPKNDAIERMVTEFERDHTLGIVAFHVIDPESGKSENGKRIEVLKPNGLRDILFIGCGAGIRSEVIAKVGGFTERFFLYMHEMEFSARVLSAGYSVKLFPDIIVYHAKSYSDSSTAKRVYYDTRNGLQYYFEYFPFHTALMVGGRHLGQQLLIAHRHHMVTQWVKAVIDSVRTILTTFNERTILNRELRDFILAVRRRFTEFTE